MQYHVYILANRRNGALYIGVTSYLIKRIWEHKNKIIKGFTSRYSVDKLVYFEDHQEIKIAIQREKRLKEWPRKWKIDLIELKNPNWLDLYYEIVG